MKVLHDGIEVCSKKAERTEDLVTTVHGVFWLVLALIILYFGAKTVHAAAEPQFSLNIQHEEQLSFGSMILDNHFEPVLPWTTVVVTTYNPVAWQTDGSPCIGAGSEDLCKIAKSGRRLIALSQDLVAWTGNGEFKYGQNVRLEHEDPRCSGVFELRDTMNRRWTNRADVFMLDPRMNTKCEGAKLFNDVL